MAGWLISSLVHVVTSMPSAGWGFLVGTVGGVYLAQNYAIPPLQEGVDSLWRRAQHWEQQWRKPPPDPPHHH